MTLLDADLLFQTLLTEIDVENATVAADLDVDSFDDVPFITHRSIVSSEGNGPDLWAVALIINVFVEAQHGWETVQKVYDGIVAWGALPANGIVPDAGAVQKIVRIPDALSRVGNAVQLDAKSITQYTGSFELTVRN